MSHITKNLDNFLANEAQKGYMKSFIRHIEYLKEDNKMKTSVPESLANKTNLNNHYLNSSNIFPNKNHTPNDSDYHDINDKVDYKNCIDPLNENNDNNNHDSVNDNDNDPPFCIKSITVKHKAMYKQID